MAGPSGRTFVTYSSAKCISREAVASAWHASPWEHRPSSLAPCAVPMRLARIVQHIKDEPCAQHRALLGVSSSRSSSVSRGVRSAGPIWIGSPLVAMHSSNLLFKILPYSTRVLVPGYLGNSVHSCTRVLVWNRMF